MAVIRPSSDLRNRYGEISEFCNKHQEPVFITKNGSGDLVVMSAPGRAHDAKRLADGYRMREELQNLVGSGAGGNVVILGLTVHQHVAHATAGPEGGMPGLLQHGGYMRGAPA